jgi:hypothetical protein
LPWKLIDTSLSLVERSPFLSGSFVSALFSSEHATHTITVADEGYDNLVADEGYDNLVADEGYDNLVADEGYDNLVAPCYICSNSTFKS